MATLIVCSLLAEIVNYHLFHGWTYFPIQVIRYVIPFVLVLLIWTGRTWARYLLGLYCVLVGYLNLDLIWALPTEYRKSHFGNVAQALMFYSCFLIVGLLAIFSSAISGLLNYRQDQSDLGQP